MDSTMPAVAARVQANLERIGVLLTKAELRESRDTQDQIVSLSLAIDALSESVADLLAAYIIVHASSHNHMPRA